MALTKSERKTMIEALEELQMHRNDEEEPREMTSNGLYQNEELLLEKLKKMND